MSSPERRQLEELSKEKVRRAIADAQDKTVSPEQLKTDIDQIDRYARLLKLTESKFTAEAGFAVLVAVICVAIAAYLWSHKVSRSSISLTAETESLQGELLTDWRLDNPFRSALVHVERVNHLDAPNLGLTIDDSEGDAWASLDGGQVTIQSLQIDRGAMVAIASDQKQLSLFISRKPIRGKLTIVGKGTISAGFKPDHETVNRPYDIEIPETLDFEVTDPRSVPTQLTVHDPGPWSLGRVPFANLNFAIEEVRDLTTSDFVSGIKSGTLIFNDVNGPPQPVAERDMLAVHHTGDARVEISGNASAIHVALNGVVKTVTLGQGDAERQLGPSLLEYFYNKKSAGFFAAAVGFIWSMIWGIRRTIFR